jgi:tRNA (guanosine-2'-O-)-methyltransferase
VSDDIEALIARHGAEAVQRALAPLLTAERIARIDGVLDARLASVTIAVENTYDPHNAAATIRTCEALGLQDVHVIAAEGFSAAKGVVRGAAQWIDLHRWRTPQAAVAALREGGFRVLATRPDAARSIDDLDVASPVAVMFGNEHDGLTPDAVAMCDEAVKVPMFGMTESFNLSVTVALVATRLAARRRQHLGRLGDLAAERRAVLRARWFSFGLRGAAQIVERELG